MSPFRQNEANGCAPPSIRIAPINLTDDCGPQRSLTRPQAAANAISLASGTFGIWFASPRLREVARASETGSSEQATHYYVTLNYVTLTSRFPLDDLLDMILGKQGIRSCRFLAS